MIRFTVSISGIGRQRVSSCLRAVTLCVYPVIHMPRIVSQGTPLTPATNIFRRKPMQNSTHEMIAPLPQLPVYFSIHKTSSELVPSHWHEHIEVLMILEGIMHLSIHDQEYTLTHNDIFVVNSSDIHSTRTCGHTRILLLQIPHAYIAQYVYDFSTVRFQEYFCCAALQFSSSFLDMQNQLLALAELFYEKHDGYELAFNARLHDFLHTLYLHFSSRVSDSKGQKNTARLREILSFIEQHYREPVTLRSAAEAAALNPEYFCRIFKKNTGITFLEYVNQVRLTHIYEELLTTEDTVTDILARNGFTNYKVFRRMFREAYGDTPTAIRRRKSETDKINDPLHGDAPSAARK